jgi:molybdenum cofactor cytidylyltransferase
MGAPRLVRSRTTGEGASARIAGALLCAGAGSRYAGAPPGHKLLAPFRGRPLVLWAVQHVLGANFAATFVVTGAVDLSAVLPSEVTVVENRRWLEGQATSLQGAVGAARAAGYEAIVVGLGDQPLIGPDAWRAVGGQDALIAVATYAGRRRNPVKLAREVWADLPVAGDEGARALMRSHPELVVEVPCAGDPVDIDTSEDLAQAT